MKDHRKVVGGEEIRNMRLKRGHIALAGSAVAVAGFMLSPAIGAATDLVRMRAETPVSLGALGSISSFTPTTKDPRLAAAYAKIAASASRQNFRFTPTSGSLSGQRSVTVMVRAADLNDRVAISRTLDPVSIAPVAFSLNSAHNWRKFALPEAVGRKELDPVAVEPMAGARNFSLDQGRKDRFSTKVLIESRREPAATIRNPSADKDYSLDLASSYSLTRNLNVTAGIRYNNSFAGRLTPMTDDRQDAQAVYLGTIFKF
ncbi:hypothetical protein SFOMI_1097 [Sphingobium fuliginis]|uniref:Uncharacterized protein n=3 Tax=Sphingobium fuliginis (strain ATCC 27551) TaxID=336203 RepID=A0A292Z2W5_SPHSA|nr:hypothetical protein SFOMI_1097 [Sphingobium fuliginis]